MAFATTHLDVLQGSGPGEQYSDCIVIATQAFENGLRAGRFAKWDTARLDNMDGSSTPVVAGVVLRNIANPVADANTFDSSITNQVEFIRGGLCSVRVKSGQTPAMFGRVFVSNAGDADDGTALTSGTVDANAEFIQAISTNVWLIYITPAPGDVAAHISDALDAHDASATSYADAGAFTTAVNVETALQELSPNVPFLKFTSVTNAAALQVARSGLIAVTTGGAETRTLAIPSRDGITITICLDTDGGDCVITSAGTINQTGNNTITLNDAGDAVTLTGITVAGARKWSLVANDGATLSTVP